jgi:hypothetical protein
MYKNIVGWTENKISPIRSKKYIKLIHKTKNKEFIYLSNTPQDGEQILCTLSSERRS